MDNKKYEIICEVCITKKRMVPPRHVNRVILHTFYFRAKNGFFYYSTF